MINDQFLLHKYSEVVSRGILRLLRCSRRTRNSKVTWKARKNLGHVQSKRKWKKKTVNEKRKNRGEDGQAGLVQVERRSLRQSRLRYLRVLGHPWTSVRFLFGVENGLQLFRRVESKLGGPKGRKQERGKGQGQRDGRDRNRVRDLGAKEADEEADALGLVSRIMVILKASERQECHSRFLKAIFSTREWLTRGCAYVYRTPRSYQWTCRNAKELPGYARTATIFSR